MQCFRLRKILFAIAGFSFAIAMQPVLFSVQKSQAQNGLKIHSLFTLNKWHVETDQALSAGEVVLIVDNDCMQIMFNESPQNARVSTQMMGSSARNRSLSGQAYVVEVRDEFELSRLQTEATEDVCLRGVSNNYYVEATQFNEDPRYDSQDYLRTIASEGSNDLLWESSLSIDLAEGDEVVIAIIDTGIEADHEDLSDVLWDDGEGNFGFDFVNNDNDPSDDQGHGTHVAGLAAAKSSNQIGISGVMGFSAKLMAVKVLNSGGGGNLAGIVNGINYASENGADVINLSLGGSGRMAAMQDAIANAVNGGATVLVAAGNEDEEITNNNFFSPAGYAIAIDGAIAVGAIDSNSRNRSNFSNYGTDFVEIAAPGSGPSDILSTYIGNSYRSLRGTSMASPIVAGAAALVIGFLRSNGLESSPAMVEEILNATSVNDPELEEFFIGGRRLDLSGLANYLERSRAMASTGGFENEF